MKPSSREQLAERLVGPEELLLVEAPAGHGKTHCAVETANRAAIGLGRGQEVLLLSHTNAARDEFVRRFAGRARVRAQTIDSLACEIVDMHTSFLGIERPLKPGALHLGQPAFEDIRRMACGLLRDAPHIARGLAYRHPVLLADEYQDSTRDQHQLIELIGAAGPVRRRLFGDRLQAIYGFADQLVDWPALIEQHGAIQLEHAHRWDEQPELRDWIAGARRALLAGEPIPLNDLPPCVRVYTWAGQAPAPRQQGHCPEALKILNRLRCQGHTAWLVRNREHAYGLARRLGHQVRLYEAGDCDEPLARLELVEAASGDPATLALLLIDTLRAWGTGIELWVRRDVAAICTPDGVVLGKRTKVQPFAAICQLLYDDPSSRGWLRALRAVGDQHAELGWRPVRRDATWLLMSVPDDAEDPVLAAQALAQARRSKRGPLSKVMTIHKAKGREFDVVVLPYVSASCFGADEEGARLAYVALSRAQREVHLLIPRDGASPRFGRSL